MKIRILGNGGDIGGSVPRIAAWRRRRGVAIDDNGSALRPQTPHDRRTFEP